MESVDVRIQKFKNADDEPIYVFAFTRPVTEQEFALLREAIESVQKTTSITKTIAGEP